MASNKKNTFFMYISFLFNLANFYILYPWKHKKAGVFRGYNMVRLAKNGLKYKTNCCKTITQKV